MVELPSDQRARSTRRSWNITLLALSSIGLATFFAVENIPDDVYPAGALFLPAVIMTIGLLLPVAAQFRIDLISVLRVENVLIVGLVYWLLLDMLQSAYDFPSVTSSDVQMAFISVATFAMAVWVGSTGQGWRLPAVVKRASLREIEAPWIFRAICIAFTLGIAKFAIASNFDVVLMLQSVGNDRWSTPWARGDLGGSEAIFDHLQYFGYILPALCVILSTKTGWRDIRVVIGLFLSAVIIMFLAQSGGRRIIGVVVGAAVCTWVTSHRRLSPTIIFGGSLALGTLLTFMQEMLRYRNVGFSAWWAGDRPELFVNHLHVDDNFLRLAQLISFYPSKVDYVYHQTLFHALTLPVPRVLWPGKPTGPGFDLPSLLGFEGVSLSSSIIGELWVSFGLLAVAAGGWIIGRIAGMWNKILQLPFGTSRALMYGLGLIVLFAGIRSFQAMVQMSYIVLAWIVVISMLPNYSQRVKR